MGFVFFFNFLFYLFVTFFFVLQICTASSKSDAAQCYINIAGVAWLRMWDFIFPFVILKYKFVFFFFFALLFYLKMNRYL